jgi:hypothetical protein
VRLCNIDRRRSVERPKCWILQWRRLSRPVEPTSRYINISAAYESNTDHTSYIFSHEIRGRRTFCHIRSICSHRLSYSNRKCYRFGCVKLSYSCNWGGSWSLNGRQLADRDHCIYIRSPSQSTQAIGNDWCRCHCHRTDGHKISK